MKLAIFATLALGACTAARYPSAAGDGACPSQPPSAKPDAAIAEGLANKGITHVCVYGLEGEARMAVMKSLRSRVGEPLVLETVSEDVRALTKHPNIDDVEAVAVPTDDKVLLSFAVKQRPRIAAIVFEGAPALEKDGLPKDIVVQKERYFSKGRMYEAMRLIRDEYHRRGYRSVAIDFSSEVASPNRVRVKISVVEGPRSKVRPIAVNGASKVAKADLRRAAQIEEGEPLDEEKIKRAVVAIQEHYLDRGLIQVQVESSLGQPAGDGSTPLTWNIVEGEVFHVRALAIGNLEGSKDAPPTPPLRSKPGSVFSRASVDADVKTIIEAFAAKKERVTVVPRREIDTNKKTVDVTFEVGRVEP